EEITQPLSTRADAPAELPELPADLGLTWRALTGGDAQEFHRLALELEVADDVLFRSTAEESRERLLTAGAGANGDMVGGFDSDGVLQAFAGVRRAPDDEGSVRVF